MEYSLGLVEVSALGNAIIMLDDMLKAADVEFVATERKLGGRLVTIVVRGELTSVQASVDAGVARAKKCDCLKASQVIARPHSEILKFLHLDEKEEKEPNSEFAGTHVGAVKEAPAAAVKKPQAKRTSAKKTASAAEGKTSSAAKRGRPKKTN
jgi:microcompartment protein CcmL/EutN